MSSENIKIITCCADCVELKTIKYNSFLSGKTVILNACRINDRGIDPEKITERIPSWCPNRYI